ALPEEAAAVAVSAAAGRSPGKPGQKAKAAEAKKKAHKKAPSAEGLATSPGPGTFVDRTAADATRQRGTLSGASSASSSHSLSPSPLITTTPLSARSLPLG
ncbi:unnamed protein product, partial [Polarella glacialis]